jgi:hypothetical protein
VIQVNTGTGCHLDAEMVARFHNPVRRLPDLEHARCGIEQLPNGDRMVTPAARVPRTVVITHH